ncbi:hypothetical protein GMD78_08725 [Ornithinibacillus sp. L9]|uniref:Transglutaminase-like domain-containing protein n=1 Tax=Ornithinibacillus caprae TaxID=2678566 RepID=A0A6N8FJJ4_9BACI|nr:transglutaminaseTgpA domain-containing protein [Ornithinibacillus caprae]MUK88474.1 hypothetical protein [Ornithinibacillus caprae]
MNRANKNNIPIIYTSILYILGLFLFLEWLYPVEQVTDTTNIIVFVIYTIFCFIITVLQVNWWVSFLLKGFGLLFIINGLFSEYGLFNKLWFEQLFWEISINMQALFSQEWNDLTGMFRSILFLIIIWLMSYLIHYWFIQMKRIFVFVVLTFVYLSVLDTFTLYDASLSIIRTFAMAFIGLGMANFFKEIQVERITFSWARKNPVWIAPLVLIVLFSTAVGYAGPKFEPQWPDPVPFIQSAAGGSGGSGGGSIQKVGYGEDDSRLGGSFVQDYTPVFQAATKKEHYWRIESKDVYTGKGWVSSDEEPVLSEQVNGDIALEPYGESVETERLETILDFQENTNISKLVYPYGTTKVEANEPVNFLLNDNSGEIRTQYNNSDKALTDYTILYDYPSFPLDKMKEDLEMDPELLEQYTQLPDSLPERIGELAEEITANYENQYDKVKAIEGYFGRNGFVYQTSDVPVPRGDYVDQFLFDSQVGYCDNYSSSMVVLLRTLDIPTRWVKGFTSGEQISDYVGGDTSYNVYEVTNSNAHSWVEVYFPEVGWVPFEPTQGFSNPADFYLDTESDTEDDVLDAPSTEIDNDSEEPDPLMPEEEDEAVEAMNPGDSDEDSNKGFILSWWQLTIIAIVVIGIIAFVYIKRYRLQTYLLERRLYKNQDAQTYQDAYHFVLKVLKHQGFAKDPDQTLREYAKRIDTWYSTDSMGRLTSEYEKILYKNDQGTVAVTEIKDLWKNLINKILG